MADRKTPEPETKAKKTLEAIAAAIGGLLAIATLSIIAWDGMRGGDTPPFVTVQALNVHAQDGGFVLEILAVNSGDQTAAGVTVEGVLSQAGAAPETSETTFDFVPRRSQSRGGLFFAADPRVHDVTLRAKGYAAP